MLPCLEYPCSLMIARSEPLSRDGSFDVVTTAGPHKLSVTKQGFQPIDPMSIRLDKGKAATVGFRLTQAPAVEMAKAVPGAKPAQAQAPAVSTTPAPSGSVAPQPAPDSFVMLKAPAGAVVHIDQQSSGQSTGDAFRIKVGPGQHTIDVFLRAMSHGSKPCQWSWESRLMS